MVMITMTPRPTTTVCCLSLVLLVLLAPSWSEGHQDSTLEEDASGTDVVWAVVDIIRQNCIFSDDRLLLRRVAFVETMDGTDTDTFTQHYHGGIWRVDKAMFEQTQPCPAVTRRECEIISRSMSINWSTVSWVDLRKPLYSGLAAALYILQQLGGANVPGEVADQAQLWTRVYRPGGDPQHFVSAGNNATFFDCQGEMDVVFVLDSSGSVGQADFRLMLQFVSAVVDVMPIGPEGAQVAQVVYATSSRVTFHLNTHTTKDALKKAIMATSYTGGMTNTGMALDTVRSQVFTEAGGARPEIRKVVILLTDGRSQDPQRTADAATLLKDTVGVVLFTIGVGGYSLPELEACATQPLCSHIFTLDNFSYIRSIIHEIQKMTCEARVIVKPGDNIGGDIPENGLDIPIETGKPDNDSHIEVEVECGEVDIYVTYTNPSPSPALYDEHHLALHKLPARIYLSLLPAQHQVFMRLIGFRLGDEEALRLNCSDYEYNVTVKPDPPATTTTQRPTTTPADSGSSHNPCTKENIASFKFYHPFTSDPTKFIQCDAWGNMYVMSCAPGTVWKQAILACTYP